MATTTPVGRTRADLVVELVLRDVRVRYRRSVLGVLWAQAAPLVYVAVLTLVFTRVVPLDIDDYPAFVLVGLLPWLWFQAALTTATVAVVQAPDLVAQPAFPRSALPPAAVASTLAHHLLALPVAVVVAAIATGHVGIELLALVPLIAIEFAVCLGPAYVLAALHVRLRDTAQIVAILLLPLFYATPVFYDADALDAVPVLRLNPLVAIIDGHRRVLLEGRWPEPWALLAVGAAAVVLLLPCRSFYRARMGRFLEQM